MMRKVDYHQFQEVVLVIRPFTAFCNLDKKKARRVSVGGETGKTYLLIGVSEFDN